MSRPDKLPSWCDDDAASKVIEMGDTKKLAGFIDKERMPFQFLNWLFRHFVQWFTHIDSSVNQFDPHASLVPDEFLNVTAGRLHNGSTVLTQSAQQIDYTGLYPASSGDSRIDRIVIDGQTGVISRVAGTEAVSPVAPAIPIGNKPICRVLIDDSTSSITSTSITDERSSLSDSANKAFKLTLSADQAMDGNVVVNSTDMANLENDPNSTLAFDLVTGRFTPTEPGFYHIGYRLNATNMSAGQSLSVFTELNGVNDNQVATEVDYLGDASERLLQSSTLIYLDGVTDYISFTVTNQDTSWILKASASNKRSIFYGFRVG